MARRDIVTRTIIGTEVTVLALNTETCEPHNLTVVINGAWGNADDKKLLKTVKNAYETETESICKVVAVHPVNKLYGMWQEDFIANAFELDPNTRKPFAVDNTETESDNSEN